MKPDSAIPMLESGLISAKLLAESPSARQAQEESTLQLAPTFPPQASVSLVVESLARRNELALTEKGAPKDPPSIVILREPPGAEGEQVGPLRPGCLSLEDAADRAMRNSIQDDDNLAPCIEG